MIKSLHLKIYKREISCPKNNIANHIVNELFEQRNILYNLWSQADFPAGPNNTVNNGLKNLRYLGPKINHLILEMKRKIKCWTRKNCSCKLRFNYIHHVLVPFFPNASPENIRKAYCFLFPEEEWLFRGRVPWEQFKLLNQLRCK